MRTRNLFAGFVAIVVSAGICFAQAEKSSCSKDKEKAACSKTCGSDKSKAGCSGEAVAAKDAKDGCGSACTMKGVDVEAAMPVITYKVGDETTTCACSAKAMAEKAHKDIVFVVAGKDYSDKPAAMAAYGDALDGYLKDLTTVKYAVGDSVGCCSKSADEMAKKSGKQVVYRLASFSFEKSCDAEKAAKLASEAAEKVHMEMVVDGKTYECPMEAKTASASCHKGITYKVGETTTECDKTAHVELAKARCAAALAAIRDIAGKQVANAG